MSSIEQTGRDVEEATQLALEQLGVEEDAVDVEILEEGSKGFLGLGQAPARVRVTLKETRPAKQGRRQSAPKREAKAKPVEQAPVEPAPEQPQPPVVEHAAPEEPVEERLNPEDTKELVKRSAEAAREVLQRITNAIDKDVNVEIRDISDEQVVLDMMGGEAGILIGKHGQTINALQYLVGIITNKSVGARQVRIILDAEGYRARREETLRNHALYLAKRVKETGQEAVLEPLYANERRIVHMALVDDEQVYTYSEGEDPERHVVISPKK